MLILIPAIRGNEKILAEFPRAAGLLAAVAPVWSSDSKHIICSGAVKDGAPWSLVIISPDTLERRVISAPSVGLGDFSAALSPDNRSMVVQRVVSESQSDLYFLRLDDRFAGIGEPAKRALPFSYFVGAVWPKPDELVLAAGYQTP